MLPEPDRQPASGTQQPGGIAERAHPDRRRGSARRWWQRTDWLDPDAGRRGRCGDVGSTNGRTDGTQIGSRHNDRADTLAGIVIQHRTLSKLRSHPLTKPALPVRLTRAIVAVRIEATLRTAARPLRRIGIRRVARPRSGLDRLIGDHGLSGGRLRRGRLLGLRNSTGEYQPAGHQRDPFVHRWASPALRLESSRPLMTSSNLDRRMINTRRTLTTSATRKLDGHRKRCSPAAGPVVPPQRSLRRRGPDVRRPGRTGGPTRPGTGSDADLPTTTACTVRNQLRLSGTGAWASGRSKHLGRLVRMTQTRSPQFPLLQHAADWSRP